MPGYSNWIQKEELTKALIWGGASAKRCTNGRLMTDDWSLLTEHRFTYDGWNVIQEQITTDGSTSTVQYVWGLDLSGSLQGAGGIGGLLLRQADSEMFLYLYDANGNIGQLVDAADGTLAAHYEYDPFGKTLVADGPEAQKNAFRFSTKYTDVERGCSITAPPITRPGTIQRNDER